MGMESRHRRSLVRRSGVFRSAFRRIGFADICDTPGSPSQGLILSEASPGEIKPQHDPLPVIAKNGHVAGDLNLLDVRPQFVRSTVSRMIDSLAKL